MAIKAIDGLPVLDAKRAIKLTVSSADIRKGDLKRPDDCAFARACRRELHVKEARVHLGRIYLRTNDTNWLRYQTPRALRSEIIAFDRGGVVSPRENFGWHRSVRARNLEPHAPADREPRKGSLARPLMS